MASVQLGNDSWRSVVAEQGRSLAWLADQTGVSRATVYSYSIRRRTPSQSWLDRAASALGIGGGQS